MAIDKLPDWADQQLSSDLPQLRARGENQDLEYIELFPQNVRELGKEIAAFATTNQGTILIGVSDNGELVGLSGLDTPAARDELLQRLEGLCRGTLRPAITPSARFAVEDGKAVMVIIVPRGSQPVYYSHNVPYVRHITASRPAEPHEVIDRIRAWLATVPAEGAEDDQFAELLGRVARNVFEVLIYADEAEQRMVNPWLDQWRAQYKYTADELRIIAAEDIALERDIAPQLLHLANALEEVANARLFIGSGPDLMELVRKAAALARAIKERWIDPAPLTDGSVRAVRTELVSIGRRLRDLASRAPAMADDGRLDDLQSEAAAFGARLLQMGYHQVDRIGEGLGEGLRSIGKRLHLVETMRLYADGGLSMQAIVDAVAQSERELEALLSSRLH